MEKKHKRDLMKKYVKLLDATEKIDRDMISDCIDNYYTDEIDYKDKICLDLGANLGGFTKIALDNGASKVCVVECDTRNFEKLSKSFKEEKNVDLYHAAVSNQETEKIQIYKNNSKQAHCSVSIVKRAKFKEYDEVRNVRIGKLLEQYKPDIVKVDIEGGEYEIIEAIETYSPEVLLIELHTGKVKQFTKPTIDRLTAMYPKNKVKPVYVFKGISSYDCFFKK